MKKLLLLFLSFTAATASGQVDKTQYNWHFGLNAGISFSSGTPVPVSSVVATGEGSAAVSDSAGNLLLYADGERVYNASNMPLPNGTGLTSSGIAAQSNLFVQDPGNAQRYYLFTVNNWTDPSTELSYSIVDMTLDGGNGDIVSGIKNIVLSSNAREQLTATRHANGVDFWILSHHYNTSEFIAYHLTASGISPTPVVSTVGMVYSGTNRYGSLRFSHRCNRLVSTLGGITPDTERVQLFDFNNSTGIVSNPITLATDAVLADAYSAEFSPDDSKLYVTAYNNYYIHQFDMNSPDIAASRTELGVSLEIKSWVQCGPDNKIYVSQAYSDYLGVINEPNLPAPQCDYQDNAVQLVGGGSCALALPNFPNTSTPCAPVGTESGIEAVQLAVYPNPATDEITVTVPENCGDYSLEITDVQGKLVKRFSNQSQFNISALPSGCYFLLFHSADYSQRSKLMKN